MGGTQFEIRSAELEGAADRTLPLTLGRADQNWIGLSFSTVRRALDFAGLGVEGVPMVETHENHVAFWARAGSPPKTPGGTPSREAPVDEKTPETAREQIQ